MNKGIDVEIIKHSISWTGIPIITWILKYPRYIHSELMTHRVFSKNSASSRAIPIEKMIINIQDDPVLPIWTVNQKGMQGIIVNDKELVDQYNRDWIAKLGIVTGWANYMSAQHIHKQNVNRILEPWMHIKIILTGTGFDNWYELRNHPDAQPEIQELAKKMLSAQNDSTPTYLNPEEWHIPFDGKYTDTELMDYGDNLKLWWNSDKRIQDMISEFKLNISVANCARISYNNVDGIETTLDKDLELFHKLIVSKPLHASPAEHQARVPNATEIIEGHFDIRYLPNVAVGEWSDSLTAWLALENGDTKGASVTIKKGKYVSNLQGWIQYRKVLEEQFNNK